jgi:hypothetical protein
MNSDNRQVTVTMKVTGDMGMPRVGYDEQNSLLVLHMFPQTELTGEVIMFRPVAKEVWEALRASEDKGTFYDQNILGNVGNPIDGGYEWTTASIATVGF